jgi:integrase
MREVFNKRPPQPLYDATWDVAEVTGFLEKLPNNNDLDLKQLTKKCAMLLALTSAKRQSDLRAIDVRFMRYIPEGVEIRIPGLTKIRTPGKTITFFFPSLNEVPKICPVACLQEYLRRTEPNRRSLSQDSKQPLFLATERPFSPVTSTSIGRWLKQLLEATGVDTQHFKPHSTRGASTSAAARKGASISDILAAADWTRETTFNRFYYRPQYSGDFGRAVIP